jgi:riboflavin synthase
MEERGEVLLTINEKEREKEIERETDTRSQQHSRNLVVCVRGERLRERERVL